MRGRRKAKDMTEIYTLEAWRANREFNAEPGQEVAEEVYNEFFNVMPPERLPRRTAARALNDYGILVDSGFLVSEPIGSGEQGPLYRAFGRISKGDGPHYYYLGLSLADQE